jgi:hypothetical protein
MTRPSSNIISDLLEGSQPKVVVVLIEINQGLDLVTDVEFNFLPTATKIGPEKTRLPRVTPPVTETR